MNTVRVLVCAVLSVILVAAIAVGSGGGEGPGSAFTYQGRLELNDQPAQGPLDLTFSLFDSEAAGVQIGISLFLANFSEFDEDGHFTVDLDFGAGVFTGALRWLEIIINEDESSVTLDPRLPIMPAPYAMYAASAPGNGGGGAEWVFRTDNISTMSKVGIGTSSPLAQLEVNGEGTSAFGLHLHAPGSSAGDIMFGSPAGSVGVTGIANNGNRRDIRFSDGGIGLYTRNTSGMPFSGNGLFINELGRVGIGTTVPTAKMHVESLDSTIGIAVDNNGGSGDAIDVFASGSGIGLDIRADNSASGDMIRLQPKGSSRGLNIYSSSSNSAIVAWNDGSGDAVRVFGEITFDNFVTALPMINMFDEGTGNPDRMVLAHSPAFSNWGLQYKDVEDDFAFVGSGAERVRIDLGGSDSALSGGGHLVIGQVSALNISMDNNEIMARSNGSAAALHLNNNGGDVFIGAGSAGTSKLSTPVLQITGGADLAERVPATRDFEPGTVLAIDPDQEGHARLSTRAYDRLVLGVVSGANGLQPGAILGDFPGLENAPPVALEGRVWVKCDASFGAIVPGDLLVTSDTAGHAMRAFENDPPAGTVIGKAMGTLDRGTGLVLVWLN